MKVNKKNIYRIVLLLIFILSIWNVKEIYAANNITRIGINYEISVKDEVNNEKKEILKDSFKGAVLPNYKINIKKQKDEFYVGMTINIKFNELSWCEDNDQCIVIDEEGYEKDKVSVSYKSGTVKKKGAFFVSDSLKNSTVTIKCLKGFNKTEIPIILHNPGVGSDYKIYVVINNVKSVEEKLMNEYLSGSTTYYRFDFAEKKNWKDVNEKAKQIMEGKYTFKKGEIATHDKNLATQAYEILRLVILNKAEQFENYVGEEGKRKTIPKFDGSLGNDQWNRIEEDKSKYIYERIFGVRQKVLRDVNGKKKDQEWKRCYHFVYFSSIGKGVLLVTAPKDDNQVEVKDENGKNLENEESKKKISSGLKRMDSDRNKYKTSIVDWDKGEPRNNDAEFVDALKKRDAYEPEDIDDNSAEKIENATSKILTAISNFGLAVAVIMLAAIGVKYMLGSVEEKAEYKKDLVPYIIGVAILFGITTFMKIMLAVGDKIANI